jgi:small subunit ribosomal protein S21
LARDKKHQELVPTAGLSVSVRNGNVDQALRKFKKKVQDSGLLREIQSRQTYEKPAEVRRRKAAQAKKRWKIEVEKTTRPQKLY